MRGRNRAKHRSGPWGPRRRASAAVVMIIVLVILQLAVVGAVTGTGSGGGHDLARARLDAVRAFYAAEAGMNMALREVMLSSDEDGDGGIGSISDDGDDATDPSLTVGARVLVTREVSGGVLTLTSRARSGDARRAVKATLE